MYLMNLIVEERGCPTVLNCQQLVTREPWVGQRSWIYCRPSHSCPGAGFYDQQLVQDMRSPLLRVSLFGQPDPSTSPASVGIPAVNPFSIQSLLPLLIGYHPPTVLFELEIPDLDALLHELCATFL